MNGVFRHPGGDRNVGPPENSETASEPLPIPRPPGVFHIGDPVWVRKRGDRCISRSTEGVVTKVVSSQTVEVDGVPRHVRNLRLRSESPAEPMPPSSPPIAPISDDDVTCHVPSLHGPEHLMVEGSLGRLLDDADTDGPPNAPVGPVCLTRGKSGS